MTLDAWLLERLVDPVDRLPLRYVPSADVLVNPRTSRAYKVVEGIATLLPDEATPLTPEELATLLAAPGVDTGTVN